MGVVAGGKATTVEPLITADALQEKIAELGAAISRDYADREPHLVVVLRGAVLFSADLQRAITISHTVDYVAISSYGSATRSSGVVRLVKDLEDELAGRDVIIVEDVVDTGLTLNYLLGLLRARNPASIEVCTLLDKPTARRLALVPLYTGFRISDEFVVGYGLDLDQRYRGLPCIGRLAPPVR